MGGESSAGSEPSSGELPITCNLAGDEQARRREAVMNLLDEGSLAGELEDGYELAFPEDYDRAMKLTEFMVSERACFPFFDLELAFGQGGLLLRIRGLEGTKQFIGEQFPAAPR